MSENNDSQDAGQAVAMSKSDSSPESGNSGAGSEASSQNADSKLDRPRRNFSGGRTNPRSGGGGGGGRDRNSGGGGGRDRNSGGPRNDRNRSAGPQAGGGSYYRNQEARGESQPGMNQDDAIEPQAPLTDQDIAEINLTDAERADLNSKNLKSKKIEELTGLAIKLKIENAAGMRRQDMVFEILKRAARLGDIFGNGVLEILPDGYGFLRSPD